MHCPDCGSEAPAGQKFCRTCGLSLEAFVRLLAELRSDTEDDNAALTRRRLSQIGKVGKIVGVISASAIWIFFSLIGMLLINTGNIGPGFMFLGLGVGSIAAFLIGTYCTPLHKKISTQKPPQPMLAAAETTNKIPPEDRPTIAMSVTEQTTARLEEKIKRRRLDE